MQNEGWFPDAAAQMDSTVLNPGWGQRRKWFFEEVPNRNAQNEVIDGSHWIAKKEPKVFYGKLLTPLIYSSCPVPPGNGSFYRNL